MKRLERLLRQEFNAGMFYESGKSLAHSGLLENDYSGRVLVRTLILEDWERQGLISREVRFARTMQSLFKLYNMSSNDYLGSNLRLK